MSGRSYLGELELMVLLALVRLGEDAYGVPVARELRVLTGREVAQGSVYAALERLGDKGLVTSHVGEATSQRGGRAKRYFCITPEGLRTVRAARSALINLWRGVPLLEGNNV